MRRRFQNFFKDKISPLIPKGIKNAFKKQASSTNFGSPPAGRTTLKRKSVPPSPENDTKLGNAIADPTGVENENLEEPILKLKAPSPTKDILDEFYDKNKNSLGTAEEQKELIENFIKKHPITPEESEKLIDDFLEKNSVSKNENLNINTEEATPESRENSSSRRPNPKPLPKIPTSIKPQANTNSNRADTFQSDRKPLTEPDDTASLNPTPPSKPSKPPKPSTSLKPPKPQPRNNNSVPPVPDRAGKQIYASQNQNELSQIKENTLNSEKSNNALTEDSDLDDFFKEIENSSLKGQGNLNAITNEAEYGNIDDLLNEIKNLSVSGLENLNDITNETKDDNLDDLLKEIENLSISGQENLNNRINEVEGNSLNDLLNDTKGSNVPPPLPDKAGKKLYISEKENSLSSTISNDLNSEKMNNEKLKKIVETIKNLQNFLSQNEKSLSKNKQNKLIKIRDQLVLLSQNIKTLSKKKQNKLSNKLETVNSELSKIESKINKNNSEDSQLKQKKLTKKEKRGNRKAIKIKNNEFLDSGNIEEKKLYFKNMQESYNNSLKKYEDAGKEFMTKPILKNYRAYLQAQSNWTIEGKNFFGKDDTVPLMPELDHILSEKEMKNYINLRTAFHSASNEKDLEFDNKGLLQISGINQNSEIDSSKASNKNNDINYQEYKNDTEKTNSQSSIVASHFNPPKHSHPTEDELKALQKTYEKNKENYYNCEAKLNEALNSENKEQIENSYKEYKSAASDFREEGKKFRTALSENALQGKEFSTNPTQNLREAMPIFAKIKAKEKEYNEVIEKFEKFNSHKVE